MRQRVGGWLVEAVEDGDGHLTVAVSHIDNTAVVCIGEDIAKENGEWSDRFTTEGIEADYIARGG